MLKVVKENIKQNKFKCHTFLIGNVSFLSIKKELDSLINEIYFNNEKSIFSNPDVIVVNEEENLTIKKEEIISMQRKIVNKSQFNINKVYIINNCENMNLSSSNSLLKLLEEPEKNIYAFLLTKNVNLVLPTIKSRCQIFFVNSDTSTNEIYQNYESKDIKSFKKIMEKLEASYSQALLINNKNFKDKEKIRAYIKLMPFLYKDCINYNNSIKLEYFKKDEEMIKLICEKNNNEKLLHKLLIINDIIKDMNYNLNINLCFDRIIIEFWR